MDALERTGDVRAGAVGVDGVADRGQRSQLTGSETMSVFKVSKAKRSRRPLKVDIQGTSGSGKTFSAIRLAKAMIRAGIGTKMVVADSENESASLYDGITIDGETWEYDVCPIPPDKQNPAGYAECYVHLVAAGYDIIIIDSMSHAWAGALARVDEIGARSRSGDKFTTGWRQVTPEQEALFRTITDSRAHLITTTRVKTEYDKVAGASGKESWAKVGTKSVQRDGAEYEYDVVIRMNNEAGEHVAVVDKVRGCTAMDGKSAKCPGPDFWKPLFDWWKSAEEAPAHDFHGGEKPAVQPSEVDELVKQFMAAPDKATRATVGAAVAARAKSGAFTDDDVKRLRAAGFAADVKLAENEQEVSDMVSSLHKAVASGHITAEQREKVLAMADKKVNAIREAAGA
jgi:ribosomal protein L28